MSRCDFGVCDGSGFVIDEATNTATDCRCRPLRISRAKAKRLEGRLPKRYEHVAFDRSPVVDMPEPVVRMVKQYVRNIEQRLDDGRGIRFVGAVGTGKTTLAMLVSRAAIDAGRSVAIYSVPRLLSVIRETMWNEGGHLELIDNLTKVDLLHLDDLGAENSSDWVLEQLYAIVNQRYEDERALVITTNLQDDELSEQIGHRTVSRIIEICGDFVVPLMGTDRRVAG